MKLADIAISINAEVAGGDGEAGSLVLERKDEGENLRGVPVVEGEAAGVAGGGEELREDGCGTEVEGAVLG